MMIKNMPWHNAESTLWTLIIHLLRRLPKASPVESREELADMNDIYLRLMELTPGKPDFRTTFVEDDNWEVHFHPAFRSIVPILREMAQFIDHRCYEFLIPKVGINPELVLYEAFQRILLQTVYQFENGLLEDVVLDRKHQREVYNEMGVVMKDTVYKSISTQVVGVKRKAECSAEEEPMGKHK